MPEPQPSLHYCLSCGYIVELCDGDELPRDDEHCSHQFEKMTPEDVAAYRAHTIPGWLDDSERTRLRLGVRNAYEWLTSTGRFEAAREIFGDVDVFNLSGVSSKELRRIIAETEAFQSTQDSA